MSAGARIGLVLAVAVVAAPEGAQAAERARVRAAVELGRAGIGCQAGAEDDGWTVRLCVSARFRKDEYNVPAYLAGLGLEAEAKDAAVEVAQEEVPGGARWLVRARYPSRPGRPELALTVAGRTFAADTRGLSFRAAGAAQVADGAAELVLADPAWAVLRSARLLPLDGPGATLLELVVENLSARPLPLSFAGLRATRSTIACGVGTKPADIQTIRIHWPTVTAHRRPDDPSGATTRLAGQDVPVEVSYQPETCSNPYSLAIRAPVQDVLPPQGVTRLLYRIEESWGENDGTPLRSWDHVSAFIEAEGAPIRPSAREVKR